MKVKCIRLLNHAGEDVDYSPWLKLGEIYHVLGIEISVGRGVFYRIATIVEEGEWPTPALYSPKCFEVISVKVPSNWGVSIQQNGFFSIEPKTWMKGCFWEGFFDHEPESFLVFKKEYDIVLSEDP
jgi:hypothetical protein